MLDADGRHPNNLTTILCDAEGEGLRSGLWSDPQRRMEYVAYNPDGSFNTPPSGTAVARRAI